MGRAIKIFITILALVGASFAVSVSVSTPTNGATVASPVTIQASASSGYPITGWRIYVDGVSVFLAGMTPTISASVPLAGGTHSVIVRAWDSTGAYGSANLSLTGGTASAPVASSGGPTPPANAIAFRNIENMWPTGKCSSGSCSGGMATVWSYYAAPFQSTPSLDGASSVYYVSGPAYSTALFWYRIGNNAAVSRFIYDFWLYTDSATPTTAEALEFDLIQVSGGRKYNFSSQCNYWTKTWDTWNEATQHWVHSNAVCQPFAANKWHNIKWALERVGTQTHYLSITVDGVTQNIADAYAWQPAPPTSWANGALVFQVQQDVNGRGGSFKQWIDKATVYAW